jgi:tetratricopeptide (TPR) repeat protein
VDAARRVVALLSPAYFEEGRHTAAEWSSALVKNEGGGHRLVPVQVAPCAVPRLLRPLVRAELFDVGEAEAVRRLRAAVQGPRRPDGAPVFPGRGSAGVLTGRGETRPRLPGVLPAVWNIGARNPAFVGRDAALAGIRERLRTGGTAVVQALHGLGGVGKTQVAIEYAHRYAGSYDVAWWVNAEKPGLIGEQYAALAAELRLTAPHADTLAAAGPLRAYLRSHGRWLLVFDNADSPAELHDWLPAGPGHILVTSRNPGWEELAVRVEVGVLSRSESMALIHAYRPGLGDADAGRLAEALGDFPLALAQAAGFLAETGMPVGQYLGLLDLDTHAAELLGENPPQAHPLPLAATVGVATASLAEVDPAALGLIRTAAFLAPDPIPASLLTGHAPAADSRWPPELAALAAAVASPVAAHRSLGRVGRFGLARVDSRGLHLHRLTQVILREALPAGQAAAYRGYAQALLAAANPGDVEEQGTWPAWARLLPHLLAAPAIADHDVDAAAREVLLGASRYLYLRGAYKAAHDLSAALRGRWARSLGHDHPHMLTAGKNLASPLVGLGKYEEAVVLHRDVYERRQRVLGSSSPFTLYSASDLADTLRLQGKFQEAHDLDVSTRQRLLAEVGHRHRHSLRCTSNLANDLYGLGLYSRARELDEETHRLRSEVLGPEHRDTLVSAANLATDLYSEGDLDGARTLLQSTYDTFRDMLGHDHPDVLAAANNLAVVLYSCGQRQEARKRYQETQRRLKRVLAEDHPYVGYLAENLRDGSAGRIIRI